MLHSFLSIRSIYFEGVTWEELTSGFDHVPGGDEYRNRSVLSYHFYRPPNVRNSTDFILYIHLYCCMSCVVLIFYCMCVCVQISPEATFTVRRDDLQRLGCAGFLTEFDISLTLSSQSLLYDTLEQADFFLQVGVIAVHCVCVCVFLVSPPYVQRSTMN